MLKNVLVAILIGLVSAMPGRAAAAEPITVTLYKAPDCTTCTGWVEHLRANVFTVVVDEVRDAETIRRKLYVPERHASCHTATVAGYVIEGHVPADDIKRLLAEHPDARGLVVPGMPQGAPGLETGRFDPFDVLLFDYLGVVRVFHQYRR